jgi:hypothetical protein
MQAYFTPKIFFFVSAYVLKSTASDTTASVTVKRVPTRETVKRRKALRVNVSLYEREKVAVRFCEG